MDPRVKDLITELWDEFCNLQCAVKNESHDDDEIKGAFQDHIGEECENWGLDYDRATKLFLELNPEFTDASEEAQEQELADWLFSLIGDYEVEGGWAKYYHGELE
jgi:hypothetical protein